MAVTVADIVGLMNRLAPPDLAEPWDNCGLQAGSPGWPADRVRVALDPSYRVIAEACAAGTDLLVTHHPLLFAGLKRVDFERMPGTALKMAVENRLSIFSAHTNLDSAEGGLNDVCAQKLGLQNIRVLDSPRLPEYRKLAVFVPLAHEAAVLSALEDSPAGNYGAYTSCSFTVTGKGRFTPSAGAKPFIGKADESAVADEVRIETIVAADDVRQVVDRIKAVHPYQTMAYDVYPLAGSVGTPRGLGRVGTLETPTTLADLAELAKTRFNVDHVRCAGDPGLPVSRVAVCSGSGAGLMDAFMAASADVFVSGELKHHNGLAAVEAGRGLIDVGHFETECLVVDLLVERLRTLAADSGLKTEIQACAPEENPFRLI